MPKSRSSASLDRLGLTIEPCRVGELGRWQALDDEACLKTNLVINGTWFHVWAIEVKDDVDGCQYSVDDPYDRLDDVVALSGGRLETIKIPGFDGEYLLVIHPHSD